MKINTYIILAFSSLFIGLNSAAANPEIAPLKVGMLVPLSGSYATGGVDNRQGAEAAAAVLKRKLPFELIYADSKADATTGISEFRKLTATNNAIAVFAMRGSVGMALNPVSETSKVPLLGGVGNKDFTLVNKYAFQVWSKSDDEGAFLANRFITKGFKSAALLTVQDDWQDAVSTEFRKGYPASGGKLTYDQEVQPSDADFRTQLYQIKKLAPDVIFANLGLSQLGPFLRQAKELDIKIKVYANFWVAKKDVIEVAGAPALENVSFIEMNTEIPALKSFINEKFSSSPSGATLAGYAAILLIDQAISKNPHIKSKEDLYAELLKQTELNTPDGTIPIENRCIKFPLVEKVMHIGKVETEK